jgi:hypothetical protein
LGLFNNDEEKILKHFHLIFVFSIVSLLPVAKDENGTVEHVSSMSDIGQVLGKVAAKNIPLLKKNLIMIYYVQAFEIFNTLVQ